MLQAFVALKPQQPPRTESGLKDFFAGLVRASYSKPTVFCTNLQSDLTAYDPNALAAACSNEECKWALLQGEEPYFWQATLVLPDKKGQAALFYYLESDGKTAAPVDTISDFSKKLFKELRPDIIRIGDDEGREKLRSRHGLSLMPGLGRVDWLQLVHPDVYGRLYNISELEAAPAYAVEVLEENVLYLRVYGDPKNWNDAENISLANMIPAFLAGIGTIDDPARERETVRQIEKLWARAHKTAERAAKVAASSAAPAAKPEAPKAAAPAAKPETPKAAAPTATPSTPTTKPETPKLAPATQKPAPVADLGGGFKLPTPGTEPPAVGTASPAKVVRPDLSLDSTSRPTVEVPQKQADAIAAAIAPTSVPTSEPAKPEPAKPDVLAQRDPIAEVDHPAKPEAPKPEPAKPEPAKVEAPKPEPAKPEPAKPEPAKPAAPPIADVVKALPNLNGKGTTIDPNSLSQAKDEAVHVPLYKAKNTANNPPCDVYISFDSDEMSFRLVDRQEDFTWFLQATNLPVSENTLDKLLKIIRTYHRPYLKHIQSIDDIPEPARKDPRLDAYRTRVKAAFIDKAKADSNILKTWAFNPTTSGLEELIVEQYQDWPLTTDTKRHEADLKAPAAAQSIAQKPAEPATQKPTQKPAEPTSQKPTASATPSTNTPAKPGDQATPSGGGSNMGIIIVVALLVVAALVYFLFLR